MAESVEEICSEMSETLSSAEKSELMKLVKESCEAAQEKIAKYFSPEKGKYPSLTFLKEVDYFYPIKALSFNDSFEFLALEEVMGWDYS